ncbi:MAG: CcmD family protein [Chitinophagaceae bacterium]
MHKLIKVFVFSLAAMLFCMPVFCQPQTGTVEMADGMRQSGKIYVVIAVILTILAGLIFYIIRLDRKISRLEKENS